MPTSLPRVQVTVTEQVADALSVAARRWPSASRSELLAKLAIERAHEVAEEERRARGARDEQLARLLTELDGAFPDGYLNELRRDWDE